MTSSSLPAESLRFLRDLAAHNDKAWFSANRDRYERDLLAPAKELAEAVGRELVSPFPEITGGALTRLHRDVRFSKDKQPFHTHIGVHYWHREGRKMEVPGFFLRIDAKQLLLGTGLHQPEPDVLRRIRVAIDKDPKGWQRAARDKAFLRTWGGLDGESLKRVPAPWATDHPDANDLKRKDFTAFLTLPAAEATKPRFANLAAGHWRDSAPLMAFLFRAMGLKA
ncbi:MAG: DUF2461 domain-containing protein [Gemmatimonadales bacterium]|nr:DUF2461 domain-containing protein [Gemmatimonadales bacterium]